MPDDIRATLEYMGLIFEGVIDSLLKKEEQSAKSAIDQPPSIRGWGETDLSFGELLQKCKTDSMPQISPPL